MRGAASRAWLPGLLLGVALVAPTAASFAAPPAAAPSVAAPSAAAPPSREASAAAPSSREASAAAPPSREPSAAAPSATAPPSSEPSDPAPAPAASPSTGSAPTPPSATSPAPVAAASDGPVALTTRLTPDPSHIGDLLTLEVTAAFPKGYAVNLPLGLDLSPLHLVGVEEGQPEPTGEGLRRVFRLQVQHFDVGEAKVPSFPLTYVGPDGEVHTVAVPPRAFTVDALLANEVDPTREGEDPPISIEYPNTTAEVAIYTALATLFAALLAWLLWRRFGRRGAEAAAPPPIPPHVEAFERLDALAAKGLPAKGEFQEYYLELTEIARAYLERRFEIPALDRTTDEIRRALLRAGDRIAPIDPTEFIEFLQQADLVKFARMGSAVEAAEQAMAYVRDLVEETREDRQPAAAAEGEGAGAPTGGSDEEAAA